MQRIKKLTAAKFTKKRRQNRNLINGNMTTTTTTITTLSDNGMREELGRYVERQTRRTKGIIKGSMENLAGDFNENFMWDPEKIYKGNRRLEFLNEISQLLNDGECNIEGMRFYLRHAAEHAADDIMHRDPYRHSTNAAANLANQWEFESYKEIRHLALNLLDRITRDAE